MAAKATAAAATGHFVRLAGGLVFSIDIPVYCLGYQSTDRVLFRDELFEKMVTHLYVLIGGLVVQPVLRRYFLPSCKTLPGSQPSRIDYCKRNWSSEP